MNTVAESLQVEDERNVWTPGPEVKDHSSDPPLPGLVYFAAPPPEIGKVLSAHSTLKAGKWPMNVPLRLAIIFTAALLSAKVFFSFVTDPGQHDVERWAVLGCTAVVAIVAGFVAWWATLFSKKCSYVGDMGFARFTWSGSPASTPKLELLQFKDAVDLRTGQTRHYHNGIYTGTTYNYQWLNASGKTIRKLSGKFQSKEGTPKRTDPYWFARMAEAAWNCVLAEAMQQELDTQGFVHFTVNTRDWINIGRGYIEICFGGGEPQRLEPKDIASLSINSGTFAIKTHDAKWFSRKGKFSFDYAKMSNAQMFLRALEALLGYQFE